MALVISITLLHLLQRTFMPAFVVGVGLGVPQLLQNLPVFSWLQFGQCQLDFCAAEVFAAC